MRGSFKAVRALVGLLGLLALAVAPARGQADLTRYVAMGDSLTAAFSSGGLHIDGQRNGYARLVSEQARGTRAPFEQPLMTDPGIPAVTQLRSLAPLTLAPKAGLGSPINLTLPRPYDNLAVPGANLSDLLQTRTDQGGLHDLILRGIGTQLEQALLLEPTFVSLWIGSNDALRAATSGVVLDGVTLTPAAQFAAQFNSLLQTLVANGVSGGVVATVPSVTTIPFVTTLPPVLVNPASGEPVFVNGAPVPLLGPDGPLSASDHVLLTASTLLARGDGVPAALGGSGAPLPDNVILNRVETAQIEARVADYNTVIRQAAADVGFAVTDAAAVFEEVAREGVLFGGARFTTDFLTGGLFSLDGVHPSPIGYAIAANAFIRAINQTYGNKIREVDLAAFAFEGRGVLPGAGPAAVPTATFGTLVYTQRAYRNLRFGLGVPSPKKLLRLKRRALEKSREELEKKQRRRPRYKMPPEPRLAAWPAARVRVIDPSPAF